MPLSKEKTKEALGSNISELMHSYKKGGKFAKGKSPKKARQMAIAAAFSIKRKGK